MIFAFEENAGSTRHVRYKAKVAFVSPPSCRNALQEHDSCFLGVSLENSNFAPLKLRAMAEWISRRFTRCTVLIGDAIHRITLEFSQAAPPTAARTEALRLGREFIEANESIFDLYRDDTDFTFLKCSQIQEWSSYMSYHRYLCDYFCRDTAFRASVERFGYMYHSRRAGTSTAVELNTRIGRSCDYFLEEFAVFCSLKDHGLPIMVYPGSFSTLAEVARGDHPGAPKELCDLIVVSLDLKGR